MNFAVADTDDGEIHRVLVTRMPQAAVADPGHLAEIPFNVVPVPRRLVRAYRDPSAARRAVTILTCDNRISGVC
jgi:hypothetical protein